MPYLYALKIGHKCCSMISLLNELTSQKELQKIMTNIVLLKEKSKKRNNKKLLPILRNRTRDLKDRNQIRHSYSVDHPTTKGIRCRQAILLFQCNGWKQIKSSHTFTVMWIYA